MFYPETEPGPPDGPITKVCADPRLTRDSAMRGAQTPCYRCLAYRPETESGCFFLQDPEQKENHATDR